MGKEPGVKTITAAVCTYNRCESLEQTLLALEGQVVSPGLRLEILVVDNNSIDQTRECVERAAAAGRWPVRYVFEPEQGKSRALNRAVREAGGEWIAFTDDDVVPRPDWVQSIYETFLETGADAAGGKIEPLWDGEPPAWLRDARIFRQVSDCFAVLDRGPAVLTAGPDDASFLFGNNFAFRRDVFAEVGLFRTDLGPRGELKSFGEDTDILERLAAAGGKIIYSPRIGVRHKVPAGRMKMDYLRSWKFGAGITGAHLTLPEKPAAAVLAAAVRDGAISLLAYACFDFARGVRRELSFWYHLGAFWGKLKTGVLGKVKP